MHDELVAQDWDIVKSLLPADWEESARQCGALRRARKVENAEVLLRLILLHVAGARSLRQTVVRAEAFGWAQLSDVTLLKRLRASGNWLEYLCRTLWGQWPWPEGLQVEGRGWRLVDATTIQEPGAVGINWRVHYSVRLPTLACDYVAGTDVRGGETLARVPVRAGEVVLAERGYSPRGGVGWVLAQEGHVLVRHQGANFPLQDRRGRRFQVLPALRALSGHELGTWPVAFEAEAGCRSVWLQAVRRSAAAAQRAQEALRREGAERLQAETLELAESVMGLTWLSPLALTALQALALYRGRWQIELVLKTLKGLLGVGDLAKYEADSARAWMQATLLTALLIERLEREAKFFSPWGYPLLGTVGVAGVSGEAGQPVSGDRAGSAVGATAAGRAADSAEAVRARTGARATDGSINGDD